ncbi:MAG: DNA repair protein RecO [Sedimenticola sp.]|nr:DNA repair protein RecO [Sedimenticola sp.]
MNQAGTNHLSLAYLLHRRPYSNSSLLVECFTEAQGRFPAIAKGVKGRGKTGPSLLQPFVPLQIGWSGKGEVKSLTLYEQAGRAQPLNGTPLYCGFYLNELLMRLLQRNDPHEHLFHLYAAQLHHLSAKGVDEAELRYFELDLLNELGYGVDLETDTEAQCPIDVDGTYRFIPERGLVATDGDGEYAISGQTLLSLASRRLILPVQLREARFLLRTLLGFYLGDKPLKSRELFRHTHQRQ